MKVIQFHSFLFVVALTFASCGGTEEKQAGKTQEQIAAEIQSKNLELQQKELALKEQELANREAELNKKKEGIKAVENARRQKEFELAEECVVISGKTYFHSSADYNRRNKAFLVKNDRCYPIRVQNNFVYIDYYNLSTNKTTSGWISIDDLEVVY
jgi:hypothetical protein